MAGMSRSLPIADLPIAFFAVHVPTHRPHADFADSAVTKEDRIGSDRTCESMFKMALFLKWHYIIASLL